VGNRTCIYSLLAKRFQTFSTTQFTPENCNGFQFYDKINQAKNEESTEDWKGLNRIYNNFVYDYLYPNPSSVMAFLDNHDTNRFLEDGNDIAELKQAVTLLLTIPRIPQLYYGTEIMMNGRKNVSDGYVRKDFPGGWAGDAQNAFTKKDELLFKMKYSIISLNFCIGEKIML